MKKSGIKKYLDTVESLDFLLKDILGQIKIVEQDQKDVPYTKLLELFFKGIDLREKILNKDPDQPLDPQLNCIIGLDQDLV